jgi:hypothetical protein
MNIKSAVGLVEMYAGRAGTKGDVINRNLIIALLNAKLSDIKGTSTADNSDWTFDTDGSTYEWDMPVNTYPTGVVVDEVSLDPISFSDARKLIYPKE